MKLLIFFLIFPFLYAEEFQIIEAQPGQTLWEISNIYLKDPRKWDLIVKYNNLTPDLYQVLTGKKLKVPVNLIKEEYRAANFIKIIGDVRVRPKGKSDWNDANKVKDLFKGDTIRTNVNSYSDVRFYTGQVLNIYANSMVVLKPPESKDSDVRLLTGQIKTKDTSIITVSAKITPKVKNTEIGAKIKEDLSTVVQVYKGEAEVEGKDKKVVVKEGFTTEVKLNAPPLLPVKTVEVIGDVNISKFDIKIAKGGIVSVNYKVNSDEFKNNPKIPENNAETTTSLKIVNKVNIDLGKAISGYRIQVAKDAEFKNIIIDRRFDVFKTLNLRNYLPQGKYYFRLSYIDLIGFEGEFTKPQEIIIE